MRALLITGHYLNSKRKAGFHNLAEALRRAGWEVVFFTTALSWLSVLRRDPRLEYPLRDEANRLIWFRDGVGSYVWFSRWHPANLRSGMLNRWSYPLFRRFGDLLPESARQVIAGCDLILFESTPGLLLFERCKELNAAARFVYRVSDDLRMLKNHPAVIDAEARFAPRFDLVSSPSEFLHARFAALPNARLLHHGIRKELFDADRPSPYQRNGHAHCVFVGNSHFDHDFLERASRAAPETRFHIIGPISRLPQRENVIAYGEMPFEQTIPYIQHADVGLQTRSYAPGAESLTDSLKVIQYTYCRLPIVAPDFLRSPRGNVYYYHPGGTASMVDAIGAARRCDRTAIDRSDIHSWDEIVPQLAERAVSPDAHAPRRTPDSSALPRARAARA